LKSLRHIECDYEWHVATGIRMPIDSSEVRLQYRGSDAAQNIGQCESGPLRFQGKNVNGGNIQCQWRKRQRRKRSTNRARL